MPLYFQKMIFRSDLEANRDVLYVFGDNEKRRGLGGQAGEMRGEPNAIGVATLAAPGSFWNDKDTERQCAVLNADLEPIRRALAEGKPVMFPADGIGTGIAELPSRAPATFAYLTAEIAKMRQVG